MEKRLALFCVLAAFILGGHLLMQAWLRPAAPPWDEGVDGAPAEVAGGKEAGSQASDDSAKPGRGALEIAPAETAEKTAAVIPSAETAEEPAEKPGETKAGKPAEKTPPKPALRPAAPLVRKTLGSLDPASGYRMLVTLNSRGGAIERIEMSSPHYRDLEEKHGYLGHLGLTPALDGQGTLVGVVGAGSPAATAVPGNSADAVGLAADDVLLSANGESVLTEAALQQVLERTKPGEKLELQIQRGGTTRQYTATLARRPLDVIRPERQSDFEPLEGQPNSFLLGLDTLAVGGKSTTAPRGKREIANLPSLEQTTWEVVRAEAGVVEFKYELRPEQLKSIEHGGRVEIYKRYLLSAAPAEQKDDPAARFYHVDMEVEIRSLDVPSRQVSYRLQGPNGLPLEGWWYMNKSGTRDVVVRTDGAGVTWVRAPEIHKRTTQKPEEPAVPLFADDEPVVNRGVRYIGVDANYFAVMLLPQAAEGNAGVFRRASAHAVGDAALLPKSHNRTLNTSFELVSDVTTITPEKPLLHKFTVFAGPKDPDVLYAYDQQAAEGRGLVTLIDLNDYGWFGVVSRPLSRILHFFFDVVGNYGVAIVMLTLLVRSCMLPISHRATKNAQKMQELSPEIKKIAEKYKSEPEKRVKAQQDLFRQHNYNPFGGCLLALCQLPIFIGLYRCLSIDIELRGAPLFSSLDWCSNLSGPDMFLYWKSYLPAWLGDETGYLGPYFNVLPLVTIALFLVNQKFLTPPATDEQTRMQQQVMKFMTIFIGVMFFKVASGLCIYFVASSCWSLAEHKLLRKGKFAAAAAAAAAGAAPPTDSAERGKRGGNDRSSKRRPG